MKKAIAVLLAFALLTTIIAVPVNALTEEEANAGYYLVGSMTNWRIDSNYRLTLNDPQTEEYILRDIVLSPADQFKVVYSKNGSELTDWYPIGFDNSYNQSGDCITESGTYNVYFRPNFNGNEDWYYECIFNEKTNDVVPPTSPTEDDHTGEPDGGYYIVFKYDNYRIRQHNRLHMEFGSYIIRDVTLSTSTPFKIAYSADLDDVTYLYPEGEDNDYIPRYNSRYFTVEFTPDGNNKGDSADMGWYDGYVSAYPCEPPQEDSTEYAPVTNTEMKRNLYEDAFTRDLPGWKDICSYEEVYYHYNAEPCSDNPYSLDWVLVRTAALVPIDGDRYGVFDDAVIYNEQYDPFDFGYGVYDCGAGIYYGITEAWDMGFPDLHDVFINIVKNDAAVNTLGDADFDGELTIIDVTYIQRFLASMIDLDNSSWWFQYYGCGFGTPLESLADYDDDGDVTILDATRIQRALVGDPLYAHDFTLTARIDREDSRVIARADASFGADPVAYKYTIRGTVYAMSVYGNDFGSFHYDEMPEPGNFTVTTGWIADSAVELPVTSMTYNDDLTLTVTAKDASGKVSQRAVLYFRNVY